MAGEGTREEAVSMDMWGLQILVGSVTVLYSGGLVFQEAEVFFFFSVRGPSFRRELYFWSWFCWPVVISKTALGIYSYFEQRSCPLRMLGFWPWAQSVSSLKQTRKLRVQGAMLDSVEVTTFKKSQEVYSQTEILYFLWPWFGSSPDCWSAFYGHLRSRIVSLFSSFPFHVVC